MSQLIPKSTLLIVDNFCGNCGNELSAQDNFCRLCGTQAHGGAAIDQNGSNIPTTAITNPSQQVSSPAGVVQTVLNNRLYVGMVIALIGPLGLPALWFSPRFSNRTKIVLTSIFVVLTTIVPLVIAWYFLDYSMRPLLEVFN